MNKKYVIYIYIYTHTHTYTHTMEYHSAIKNENLSFETIFNKKQTLNFDIFPG